MKKKSTEVRETKTESGYRGVYGDDAVVAVSKSHNDIVYWARIQRYLIGLLSVVTSLAAAIASLSASFRLFSDLPQIPQAYASLIGMVVSSFVGISVTFLLARLIYKKRKAETAELIHRVRSKEKELFKMLDLDFDSITRRRDLNAGQTN